MELYDGKFRFDQLARERPVLLDTSALIQPISEHHNLYGNSGRKFGLSIDFYTKKVLENPGRVFVPQLVVDEYLRGEKFNIRKKINLIGKIRDCGGIVRLDENEASFYKSLSSTYEGYKNGTGLDEVDFDFALTSIVLAVMRVPLFSLTNDLPLAEYIIKVSEKRRITRRNLCCLTRWEFDSFEYPLG